MVAIEGTLGNLTIESPMRVFNLILGVDNMENLIPILTKGVYNYPIYRRTPRMAKIMIRTDPKIVI